MRWTASAFVAGVVLAAIAASGCLGGAPKEVPAGPENHRMFLEFVVPEGRGVITFSFWVRPTVPNTTGYNRLGFQASAQVDAGVLADEGRAFVLTSSFAENASDGREKLDRMALAFSAAAVGLPIREMVGAWLDGEAVVDPVVLEERPFGWGRYWHGMGSSGDHWKDPVRVVWSIAYVLPPLKEAPVARFWFNVTGGHYTLDAQPSREAIEGPQAAGIISWQQFGGRWSAAHVGPIGTLSRSEALHASFSTVKDTWVSWTLAKRDEGTAEISWRNDHDTSHVLSATDATAGVWWSWSYKSCMGEAWNVDLSHLAKDSFSFVVSYASWPSAESRPLLGMPVDEGKDLDLNACNPFPGRLTQRTYPLAPVA